MSIYVNKAFKELHKIPETGFNEHRTSAFILGELEKFGYRVLGRPAETGIVARLDSGKEGPSLAVRADMDALHFESNGKEFNLHACGHDANSSMVLAMAKDIAKKGIARGKLTLIFQPAEETGTGARTVIESGLLENVEEMVGIHLRPIQEARLGEATPALCHGAATRMDVRITGQAAHGARPHLGINAVDAGCLVVNAINAIRLDPRVPHSIKVTRFHGGFTSNIIPSEATLTADIRAQSNEVREDLLKKAREAVIKSSEALRASAEIEVQPGTPASKYDDETVSLVRKAITEVLGSALDPIITPGAEDFHYYSTMAGIKTAYIGLGADLTPGLHAMDMTFDHKALTYGLDILDTFVSKRLG